MARTRDEIAERFTAYGLPEPDVKAAALVRHLQRSGWRVHLELADRPGPRGSGSSEAAQAALAEARAVLAEKRGSRPERATP